MVKRLYATYIKLSALRFPFSLVAYNPGNIQMLIYEIGVIA